MEQKYIWSIFAHFRVCRPQNSKILANISTNEPKIFHNFEWGFRKNCSDISSLPRRVQAGKNVLIQIKWLNWVEHDHPQMNSIFLLLWLIFLLVSRTIRIWLKRETGKYWPSVCYYAESKYSTNFNRFFVIEIWPQKLRISACQHWVLFGFSMQFRR